MIIFKLGNSYKNNQNISFQQILDGKIYNFTVKWNDYAECAFLWLYDANMNPIVLGRALVNGLKIRTDRRLLPQNLYFINLKGDTFEPDLNNIGSEFAFVYGS